MAHPTPPCIGSTSTLPAAICGFAPGPHLQCARSPDAWWSPQPLVAGALAPLGAHHLDVVQLSTSGPPPREALLDAVRGAEALVCLLNDRIDADVLHAGAPTLRVVSNVVKSELGRTCWGVPR